MDGMNLRARKVALLPKLRMSRKLWNCSLQQFPNVATLVAIGVAAASEFYGPDKTYIPNFSGENNGCSHQLSKGALKDFYKSLVTDNHVVSIEEAFDKDDCESYSKLTAEIGKEVQILGDEFLVTDPKRIERAIKEKTCNTLLLKLKHLRTVTETIHVVKRVKEAGWGVAVASHGSGETDDNFVAHLAVGLGACQIKAGASCKFERHSIYREVEEVECFAIEDFGAVDYAGAAFNNPLTNLQVEVEGLCRMQRAILDDL